MSEVARIALLILGAAAAAIIISMAHIAGPLRRLFRPPIGCKGVPECEHRPALLVCPLCSGYWVGLAAGIYAWSTGIPCVCGAVEVVALALTVSLTAYVAGTWLREHDRPHP
jgi:hypothetical protein